MPQLSRARGVSGCVHALLAGLLVASVVAVAVPAAGAQEGTLVATPRFVPAAGPVVAGLDQVAWVRRRDDAVLDLWESGPAVGARFVQRFSGTDSERLRVPRLTASPAAVGLKLRVTDRAGRTIRTRIYAGAFGEPLRSVAALPEAEAAPAQAAHVARGCTSAQIRTGPPPQAPREPRCALRLRKPLRVRGDRLRLGVSCAGFRIECAADVVVRAGRRVIARGPARYNHATPPFAAADLPLTRTGRRLLRERGGRLRVRVTARIRETALAAESVTRTTTRTIGRS